MNFYRRVTMKLALFLTTITIVQATAASLAQPVTLTARNVSLTEAMRSVQAQTGYLFFLKGKDVAYTKVNVTFRNEELKSAMNKLLAGLPLTWELEDGTIIIQSRSKPTRKLSIAEERLVPQHEVTGRVVNEAGDGIEGVTVTVKGTTVATYTDAAGNYRILVPENGSVLLFTILGYEATEQTIGSRTHITIQMQTSVSDLEEVVVVGYGTQKKGSVIGSVSQVSAEQIGERSVPQLSQALTGQMPGVTIIQRTGRPGSAGGEISVRGVGSFGASPAALVLIDGIPGNLNDVNPNDVESVSVLKDASTAAIYGSRAANGVILVTTKLGKDGKTQINYSGSVGIQKATELPDLVNSWEYAELYNEATGNEVYTTEDIQKFKDGSDPDNFPNSDFIGAVFSRDPIQTAHNLQLNGGNATTQYVVSLGYLNQQGLLERNNYSRYNVRLNLTNKISDKLTLFTRLSGVNEVINEPAPPGGIEHTQMPDIINLAVRIPSVYVGQLSNGDFGTGHAQMGTPLSYISSESFYLDKPFELNANMRLDWQVLADLKLSAIGGYQRNNRYQKRFLASQRLNANILLGPTSVNQFNEATVYGTLQALAEYDKTINDHHFGILGGYSFEANRFDELTGYRDKLPGNDLSEINVGSPDGQTVAGTATEWALQSFFGRLRYDFANKYLLESTVRYDGSSRFPTDKKYAFFPSVAVGWRLSEEGFFKEALPWVHDFKLKASYGELGNQNIQSSDNINGNYPYQTVLQSGYGYPFGGVLGTGVAATTLTDPLLHWETTRTTDAGIDVSVLSGELGLTASYFNRKTFDILYKPSASVSKVLGKELSETNTGSLRNYGWEFTAYYRKQLSDVHFAVEPNFSIINNRVLDLGVGNIYQPNGMVGNGSDLFIGHPMQLYYGYIAEGLYTNDAEITAGPDISQINPQPHPGDIRYRDVSGPDGIPDGKVDPVYDRVVLGSRIPKYTFGLALGGKYKGFELNALIQGVAKVKGKLIGYAGYAFYNTASIQRWMMEGRWTPENPDPDAAYPRLELISNQGTPNTVESSFWLPDASYVRLKNIQLGYGLPASVIQGWKVQGIRFYVTAENLYTWNRYRQGWDPEINTNGSYYPIFANYTFGLNLTF